MSSARGSMPATAGMSRDRARIETCDDAPPAWVQKPTTFVRSSEAVSDGVRSSAMRIVPSGMSGFSRRCPVTSSRTRWPTSRTSVARWASNSFVSPASRSA